MSNHYSYDNQSPDDLIEEVMRRILERAQRIDAAWERGPKGDYIARGNKIRVLLGFDLPENAQTLIEKECKTTPELTGFTKVIIDKKRWVIILFPPLKHRL